MTERIRLVIHADVETCAGTGQCVLSDPTVFGHDEAHLVRVLHSEVDDHPELADAISMCPTGALSASDAVTGRSVYP